MNIATDLITVLLIILAHVAARPNFGIAPIFEKLFSLSAVGFVAYTSWRYVVILSNIFELKNKLGEFSRNAMVFFVVFGVVLVVIFCLLPDRYRK